MIRSDDIVDLVCENLQAKPEKECGCGKPGTARIAKRGIFATGEYNRPYTSLPQKRIFLSEYDVKRIFAKESGAKFVKVPKTAIVSPLATDWLDGKGIELIKE